MTFFSEHRGTFSHVKEYRTKKDDKSDGNRSLEIVQRRVTTAAAGSGLGPFSRFFRCNCSWNFLLTFRTIFLPHGFPDSVSSDYVEYQIYDTIQAFSSSITGALATEAVFKSVGVGSKEASPLAAALTWLIKSGSGMVSGIVFTWSKGTALDYDNKKWRLFADILNDTAICLDLVTPLFPASLVVYMFSLSSIARALVGVAGGATRAAITQHQARKNNAADVSAKDASQETLVNLISLIVSLFLLPAVSGHPTLVWTLFLFFTFLHVLANYRALRALNLESFNTSRILIALQQYMLNRTVPTVHDVNQKESLVVGFGVKDKDVCGFRIRLGISLEEALPTLPASQVMNLITESEGTRFLIIPNLQEKVVNVILSEHTSSKSVLEAYARSVLAAHQSHNSNDPVQPFSPAVSQEWETFSASAIKSGFDLSCALIEAGDWRAKWKHS